MSARSFDPVFLPEGVSPADGRASLTFLRHFDSCKRAGFLYATGAAPGSHAMHRGSAIHAAIERCVQAIYEQGEGGIPPEVAKAIVDEVLAEHDVPLVEHDYVRMCVYRWADEWRLDPDRLAALETLFELDVDGLTVRCKIDYAELSEDGSKLEIRDWKSSRAMVSQDQVAGKRADGSFSARNMQLVVYALAMVFGAPLIPRTVDGEIVWERQEPVAPRAQEVSVGFVYPGIVDRKGPREGLMAMRCATLTPIELHEYMGSLRGLAARVAASVQSGDFPATPSATACSECPAPMLCPIPPELRTYRDSDGLGVAGYVNSLGEAQDRAALVDRAKATVAAWEKELKAWSKANGGVSIPFGSDLEFAWVETGSETFDRDAAVREMRRCAESGEEFDPQPFVRARNGVRWTRRARSDNGGLPDVEGS